MAIQQATSVPREVAAQESEIRGRLQSTWVIWRRKPSGVAGFVIIALATLVAIASPLISPHDPGAFVGGRLESPSLTFLLGTDSLGRDVLSRTIYGAQVSMTVGFTSAFAATLVGSLFAIVGGYLGGIWDNVFQRALEVLASFPSLILVLILVSILGAPTAKAGNVIAAAWQLRALEAAIALSLTFPIMRIVRSAVLKERSLPYVEAALSLGASTSHILVRHILPNVLSYIIVAFSSVIATVILIEAAVSFLGYGVSSGTPSWGGDLSTRNREFFAVAPWLMVGPGVALSLAVLGFNFLGDALRDILDPRLRGNG